MFFREVCWTCLAMWDGVATATHTARQREERWVYVYSSYKREEGERGFLSCFRWPWLSNKAKVLFNNSQIIYHYI